MRFDPLPSESMRSHVEQLRMEAGWVGVKEGLGRILIGYYVLIFGTILTVAFMGFAVAELVRSSESAASRLGAIWGLYTSVAVIGLIQLFGFITVLRGKWTCLLNCPDRGGARWLIFGCMVCIIMGPVFQFVCFIGGLLGIANSPYFPTVALILQCVGIGLGLAGSILFVLFLRAVVSCFGDEDSVAHLNLFLILDGLLTATVILLFLTDQEFFHKPGMLLVFVACGIGVGIWYLYLVNRVHWRISALIRLLPSPLEM
jgi:hypothetical protein